MDNMPDNIFDDLMLDMIQKYSKPPVTAAYPDRPELSQPQPPTQAKEQLAAVSSRTDPRKATSSTGHVGLLQSRAPRVVIPDHAPPRDAPSLGIDSKENQESNFDDVMLNLIGKYSGSSVTDASVDPPDPSEPKPETSGYLDKPQLSCYGSAASSETGPQKDTSSSGQPSLSQRKPPLVSAGSRQPRTPIISSVFGQLRPPLVSAGAGQPRPPLVSVGSGQPRPPLVSAGSGQPRPPLVRAGQPRPPLVSAGSGQPRPPLVSAGSGQPRPPLVSAGSGQPRPPLVSTGSGQPRPPLVRAGQPRPPLVSTGSGQPRPPLRAGQPRPPLVSAGSGHPRPPLVSAGQPRPPLVSVGSGQTRPPLVSAGQPRSPLISADAPQPAGAVHSTFETPSKELKSAETTFDDLMLDVIRKNSGPPVTAANLPQSVASDPQPQTHTVDSSDQRPLASDGSAASSGKKPQQNTSMQGPASLPQGSNPVRMRGLLSSSTMLPRYSDSAGGLNGGPTGTMDVASSSCSKASGKINVIHPAKKKPPPAAYDFCLTKLDNVEHKNKCEAELISWALSKNIFRDADLSIVNAITVKNLLLAFRIPLSADLQDQCLFSKVWVLFHSKFKPLALDRHIWNLLQFNRDPEAKIRFARDVLPLDKKLEDIQGRIINATTPLFGICNFLEQPQAESKQWAPTLEDALCLCRESMIMCGQVFSVITVLRQERVVEQLHLHKKPPPPSIFQNLESTSLFGRDYMSKLSSFMTVRKQTAYTPPATPRKEEDLKNMSGPINYRTKCAIDRLAEFVVEMNLGPDSFNVDKMANNPNFWFLAVKESKAYKLYQKKLAEFRKSFASSSDSTKNKDLNLNSPPSTAEASAPKPPNFALAPKGSLAQPLQMNSATPALIDCFQPAPPPPKKIKLSNDVAESASQDEFPNVDSGTRETAERLAKLVVDMGLDKLKLYMQKIITNPTYWFLTNRTSQAYGFYQRKLRECHEVKKTLLLSSNQQPPVQLKSGTV